MDKLTYLAELAEGLARWVPERERQDILRYYAEYFEEAGPQREAEVVRELGDPWALSCRLAVEGGYVTSEQANSWTPPKKKRWPWVVAGLAVALFFVLPAVAMMAMRVGRTVGQAVFTDTVVEDVAQAVPVDEAGFGAVTFIEGVDVVDGTDGENGGFWSMEDGYLDAFDTIDANISFGNVTITGGVDYTLAIQQEGALGGYELKWEIKGGTLKIQDAKSGGVQLNPNSWSGKHSLDVIITVPETVELEKITAETDLGDVFLSDVYVKNGIEAKTALGDVECYEVRTPKKLTLKSNLGDVVLGLEELYDGMDIDLETNLGQVEANLGCYEEECAYELGTDLGTVTVNGRSRGDEAEQKGNYPYKLDAESDLGDVNVYFYDSRWQ